MIRYFLLIPFVLGSHGAVFSDEYDYSWLKAENPSNIFVYADFSNCEALEDKGKAAIDTVLSLSRIKYTMKPHYIFSVQKEGKHEGFLVHHLTHNRKPFLYVSPICMDNDGALLYTVGIYFAYLDSEVAEVALLYSSPSGRVTGRQKLENATQNFKEDIEKVIARYIKANF